MPRFNDIDIKDYENSPINTDSLWIINERDKSGKHSNFYHGNFIPQIPNQFILRYTKKDDVVLDMFLGSGTTAIECERLERNCIGVDIQQKLVEYVNETVKPGKTFSKHICGDSASKEILNNIKNILQNHNKKFAQLVLLHPPYFDIIKFSDYKNDLSNTSTLDEFRKKFIEVVKNSIEVLEPNRYLAIVIGDKYSNSEWIPLGFYLMEDTKHLGLKLKSIIIKNMSGNRAKQNMDKIWRYRALSSDYYIFKHEYIFVFKKEKDKTK
jgi:DNA modification methylase